MAPQEHAQLIRKAFEEWKKGNIDFIDEVYAQNCSVHDPFFPSHGVAEMKAQARQMRSAVADMHMEVHEVLADGDMTAARYTMGGTPRGEFQGLPATGKSFVSTGVMLDKWEGDRIVEEWNSYDMAGILQQLGLMPDQAQLVQMASQRATR
jgi:steroid delta-isomerase-like uncharacterized protein